MFKHWTLKQTVLYYRWLTIWFLIFRAFDIHKRKFLTFKEVLLGLAALEHSTQHGGMPAEMRCRYIFRYYDKNSDGNLQFEEFR